MRLRRHIVAAPAAAAMVALCAIAAAAGPLASPAATPAAGPWSLAPGEYYTELYGSSFSTGTGFDDGGTRVQLGGQRVEERAIRSYTEMGWKKHWSFQMWLPFVTNSVRDAGTTGGMSISGLQDIGLGFRWKLKNGAHAAALQFSWEAPTGYNDHLTLPVGDGQQKLSASLQLGGPAGKRGLWELGGGYRYDYRAITSRTSGTIASSPDSIIDGGRNWSDHAIVNAAYGHWFGNLQVAGIYGGSFPVQTGRGYEITQHTIGPRFTYRVDERLDAFAGSWHTPAGKNTPHLDEYYAGVAWKLTKLDRLQGFIGGNGSDNAAVRK